MENIAPTPLAPLQRFVIPATVMLTFVSFWRASAIVLGDLGSSAYYVGGIAEAKIGKAAPWFVLGIMLFSYAVRAVYMESCSMFTRGGVYRVVRESMGSTAAKFSVGALMFDYVLTGPISAVSAGLYLTSLIDQLAGHLGLPHSALATHLIAAIFAIAVIVYFWWANTVGIPYSSTRALRVMQVTTVMVLVLIGWSLLTLSMKGFQAVPAPTPSSLTFGKDSLGWLKGTHLPDVAVIAILIGLGHSLLAMSGEESLAQVYREIEAPKRKNLKRTALVIFVYSLIFTSLVSFFAVMLIPDDQRQQVQDNLISGIAMVLVGPEWLRLSFQAFVVVVGILILSAAVNTSLIGSNGVLNRVAEDGVLPAWFRKPHARYGTTYRIITLIAILQIATVALSRGDVTLLGEAYAFGVAWSFAMKSLGVTLLRFTRPGAGRWRVPLNIRFATFELPVGLLVITSLLFLLAATNLLTKPAATIGGISFTLVFFVLLSIGERRNAGVSGKAGAQPDLFRLKLEENLSPEALKVRAGALVIGVHDPERLNHVEKILQQTDFRDQDIVLVAVKPPEGAELRASSDPRLVVGDWETRVFSTAIAAAEDQGKPVTLVGLSGDRPFGVVLQAALALRSRKVVFGASEERRAEGKQIDVIRREWDSIPGAKTPIGVDVIRNETVPGLRIELSGDGSLT